MKITKTNYNEIKTLIQQYEKRMVLKGLPKINNKDNINKLDMSIRLYNVLTSNNVNTIMELKKVTIVDCVKMKNFGQKTIIEIRDLFKSYDWILKHG